MMAASSVDPHAKTLFAGSDFERFATELCRCRRITGLEFAEASNVLSVMFTDGVQSWLFRGVGPGMDRAREAAELFRQAFGAGNDGDTVIVNRLASWLGISADGRYGVGPFIATLQRYPSPETVSRSCVLIALRAAEPGLVAHALAAPRDRFVVAARRALDLGPDRAVEAFRAMVPHTS